MFVWYDTIKNSIFDITFQVTYFAAWLKIEYSHYFFSVYRRLEVPDSVFFLKVLQFMSYKFEVVKETLLSCFVLGRYICLAKTHKVVNVITGFE